MLCRDSAAQKMGQSGAAGNQYENLLNRRFHADRPNSKWATDIFYIHTKQGVQYLSMIWELYDNSIVAYKTSTKQTINLVLDTIRLVMRKGEKRGPLQSFPRDQGQTSHLTTMGFHVYLPPQTRHLHRGGTDKKFRTFRQDAPATRWPTFGTGKFRVAAGRINGRPAVHQRGRECQAPALGDHERPQDSKRSSVPLPVEAGSVPLGSNSSIRRRMDGHGPPWTAPCRPPSLHQLSLPSTV